MLGTWKFLLKESLCWGDMLTFCWVGGWAFTNSINSQGALHAASSRGSKGWVEWSWDGCGHPHKINGLTVYIYIYCKNHGKKSAISSFRSCLGDVSTRLLPIQANALKIPEDFGGWDPKFPDSSEVAASCAAFCTVVFLQEIVIPALQFHSEWVYCTILYI